MLKARKLRHAPEQTTGRKPRHLVAVSDRKVPVLPYIPAGRTLHLVDIENEAGGTNLDEAAVRQVLASHMDAAGFREGDHIIVGCNPKLAVMVKAALDTARVTHRGGPDGADLALLDAAGTPYWIAERYHRVVIGSGDHIFADLATDLVAFGVTVNVVSRPDALSYLLYCIPEVAIVYLESHNTDSVPA